MHFYLYFMQFMEWMLKSLDQNYAKNNEEWYKVLESNTNSNRKRKKNNNSTKKAYEIEESII